MPQGRIEHVNLTVTDIERSAALFEKLLERYTATGKLGESHVVADAIEFLLSDKSSFISGAAIPIQGGQHSRLY